MALGRHLVGYLRHGHWEPGRLGPHTATRIVSNPRRWIWSEGIRPARTAHRGRKSWPD